MCDMFLTESYRSFRLLPHSFPFISLLPNLLLMWDVSHDPDCACKENIDELEGLPNYKFVKGNICSSELVNYVLETEKIDTIMHFAAQTHVDNSFGNSFQFTHNNIMGTHVLLESAKSHGIKRFIHVSTDEVYGEQRRDQDAMDDSDRIIAAEASDKTVSKLHTILRPFLLRRQKKDVDLVRSSSSLASPLAP